MLAIAGVFLLALALLYRQSAAVAPGTDYTISVQRQTPAAVTPEPPEPKGPVNINTAGEDELRSLTGIGPVLAQRIIDYREANGPFRSVEELLEVSGIGEATLEKFREDVVIGTEAGGEDAA